ncbi:MAG: hypothetical protein HQL31_03160 [Planctomycetes bacterium]|nr:hypothetical protein [Planctomycetota bacterium]
MLRLSTAARVLFSASLLLCSHPLCANFKNSSNSASYEAPARSYRSFKIPKKEEVLPPSESQLIASVRTLAVLPFFDETGGRDNTLQPLDLVDMGEYFSSHLVGAEVFERIIYPRQASAILAKTTYDIQSLDDLKDIGNELGVDALVYGVIKEYRGYYPPKLSVSMKFFLTKAGRFASSSEISSLAHSGVPLGYYNPSFFRQLWDHSAFYDGSNELVLKRLKLFLRTHNAPYGFGEDRFLRTKSDFLNFISFDLASSLYAVKIDDNPDEARVYRRGRSVGGANQRESEYFSH